MSSQSDTPEWRRTLDLANETPRCQARHKSEKQPCRAPVTGARRTCRMHGGTGGAPKGERNGAHWHGGYTLDAVAERRQALAAMRRNRELVAYLDALATNGE